MEKVNESPVTLDPSGDLLLIVNQAARQKTFRVSSVAMGLASPVWRAMLSPSGKFKEAHSKNGEVCFPEDDPDAMFTVLSAVHYQFQYIPKTLSSENLLNLGIVCDKYDVTKLMMPWYKSNWLKYSGYQAGGNSILIAWLFHDLETFKRLVDHMVRDSKVNELGTLEVNHLLGMNSKMVEELSSGLLS